MVAIDSENLFNFREKSHNKSVKQHIKRELLTPDHRAHRTASVVASRTSTNENRRFSFESSSVFEVPNATDEIICFENRQYF